MRLSASRMPSAIISAIISASGMATGGRVLHHLRVMAPDDRHHIVFVGFQVGKARGAHLVAGAGKVKIHGDVVPVRAPVSAMPGFSGHADADDLLAWLGRLPGSSRQAFVVHGEREAADALRLRIKGQLGCQARVPQDGEVVRV